MADTFQSEPACFCKNAETFRDDSAQMAKLHTNRPKVWFRNTLPWLSLSQFADLYFFGVNKWSKVCNVEATKALTEGSADWIITCVRIDGRGQVLADMMLPGPRPQHGRFDATEDSNEKQLWLTAGHEGGHGYGLMHFDASPPPEWMEPRLNMGLDGPQAAEAKMMVSWYGEPRVAPVDPLPPIGGGSLLTCVLRMQDNGKDATCSIEATKPGYQMTLSTAKPKTWEPSPKPQPLYVAPYPAQEIQLSVAVPPPFVEQDEAHLGDTELYDEGDLT